MKYLTQKRGLHRRSSKDVRRRRVELEGLSGRLPTRRLRPRLQLSTLGRWPGCLFVLREHGRVVFGDNPVLAQDVEPFLVRGNCLSSLYACTACFCVNGKSVLQPTYGWACFGFRGVWGARPCTNNEAHHRAKCYRQ